MTAGASIAAVRQTAPWRHIWTISVALIVYLGLLSFADRPELGALQGETAHRASAGIATVVLLVLAWRWWPTPAIVRPGRLGRRLVLAALGLLAGSGAAAIAVSGAGLFRGDLSVLDPAVQVGVVVLLVGVVCGGVARARERGLSARSALRRVACAVLLAVLGIFGIQAGLTADLTTVRDLPWFLLFAVLLAVPALAHVRRPETAPAVTLQVAAVLVAHAVGPALAGYLAEDPLAQILVALAVVLLLLNPPHPARMRPRTATPDRALVAIGALGAVSFAVLAGQSAIETVNAGPGQAEVVTVFALSLLTCIVLACTRAPGWRILVWTAAIAAAVLGTASVISPDVAGSWGRGWGAAAVCWSIAFLVLQSPSRDRPRLREPARPLRPASRST